MKLIALETSTRRLSVALWLDGVLIEHYEDVPNGGSELLLPWVIRLMNQASVTFPEIDGVAYGAGPGGFTGLRLACGIAQGLAFGLNRPVIGVSSLEALALEAYAGGCEGLLASLDARMSEVYYAAYMIRDGASETLLAPTVAAPQSVQVPPERNSTGWIGCGNGFAVYPDLLKGSVVEMRADFWPSASAVAQLAAPRLARGEGLDAGLATPLYVRDKVALTTAERLARGGLK